VPEVRFLEPRDGDFFTPGQPVRYALRVRDAEDGSSADFEENFHARAYVRALWGRGDAGGAEDEPGLALMKRSDCFDCHAVEQKIVAPPFVEIAARYRGQPGALDAAVQRVLKGSSGVWGEVPMLPHPALTDDLARQMVQWIFARQAARDDANLARGLDGALAAPRETQARVATLEATYTDRGRPPAGALAGRATVKLRHRRVEAEHAEEKQGLKALGSFLGAIDHGHYARFAGLNLAETASATFRVASGGQGGAIELRAGTATGPVLARVSVPPTGGWETWVELTAPLTPPTERGDVFLVFVNPGKGGLMNLDWVQFNPR
jgi:cytochrome c